MKKLFVTILALTLSVSAFAASYEVRNYCEDEAVYKYTTQAALDEDWKAAGCEAHTVSGFTVLGQETGIITADQGYVYLPYGAPTQGLTGLQPVTPADKVRAIQIVLPFRVKVSDIQFYVTVLEAAKNFGCGIYSADGNTLLLETGGVSTASTGKKKVTLGTAVTLEAGVYWYAWTADGTTMRLQGVNPGSVMYSLFDDTNPQVGNATNTGTAGALPATLGTISYVYFAVPVALIKP